MATFAAMVAAVMAAFFAFSVTDTRCAQAASGQCPATDTLTLSRQIVANNDSADADSQVKGDTDANLTYWDASTDRVGFGTASPASKVSVNGTFDFTTLNAAANLNNQALTNLNADSGTVDGTTVGGSSAAAGTFTALTGTQNTAFQGDISPSQITGDQNNYNPASLSTATILRLSTDASRTITGLAGGADGRVITLLNVGSNDLVLSGSDGSSSAANQFSFAGTYTIGAQGGLTLIYDSTSSRWRITAAMGSGFQRFTGSGTWTMPSGIKGVRVVAIGAGGGGGNATGVGASGGGGGAFVDAVFSSGDLSATVTVTIGAGGAAATAGGNSTFGSYLTAYGGGGGVTEDVGSGAGGGSRGAGGSGSGSTGGTAGAGTASGAGGAGVGNGTVGNPSENGGGGGAGGRTGNATGLAGGDSTRGGGGGGSGGVADNGQPARAGGNGGASANNGGGAGGTGASGTAGTDGTASTTGAGGGGAGGGTTGSGVGTAGGAGGTPGGGGGGAGGGNNSGSHSGGAGARGEIRVWW
jgi:hypothetical protein